jgi:hypothetical protein
VFVFEDRCREGPGVEGYVVPAGEEGTDALIRLVNSVSYNVILGNRYVCYVGEVTGRESEAKVKPESVLLSVVRKRARDDGYFFLCLLFLVVLGIRRKAQYR